MLQVDNHPQLKGRSTAISAHTRRMGVSAEASPELGRGSRYLTLIGRADASVFMEPLHSVLDAAAGVKAVAMLAMREGVRTSVLQDLLRQSGPALHAQDGDLPGPRSEEHTSELQSLMRISYAVICLKNKLTYFKYYLTKKQLTNVIQ